MRLSAHDLQQTIVCVFWDAYQILGDDTHWMLPHSLVIFEVLSGLSIVTHSAVVLWIADVGSRERDTYAIYGYSWPDEYRIEQLINGSILPFLM